jgi:hypothetical protein
MNRVKPTPIKTPRIVQPGDGRGRPWLWLLVVVALAGWTWQVFEYGRLQAGFSVSDRNVRESELQGLIEELQAERDALRAEAARFERSGQIDRAAAEDVQAQIKALQTERSDLRREIAFLKGLVSGSEEHIALALANESLAATDDGNYAFEVTLSKRDDASGTVEGEAVFSVNGELDGESRTLDMETLTSGRRSRIGIRFKNFQKLSAEFKLPEDFEPREIVVAVRPKGKGFKAFEQTYDWQVKG